MSVDWRETTFGPDLWPLFAVNATRHCHSSAEWSNTTNYRDCLCNCTSGLEGTSALEISIIIYLVGNSTLIVETGVYVIQIDNCDMQGCQGARASWELNILHIRETELNTLTAVTLKNCLSVWYDKDSSDYSLTSVKCLKGDIKYFKKVMFSHSWLSVELSPSTSPSGKVCHLPSSF